MNNQHIGIDETWYCRLPAAKERIAAGGVVLRQEDQCVYLALAREADIPPFVLPKGEVEPGESLEAAARREIREEGPKPTLLSSAAQSPCVAVTSISAK